MVNYGHPGGKPSMERSYRDSDSCQETATKCAEAPQQPGIGDSCSGDNNLKPASRMQQLVSQREFHRNRLRDVNRAIQALSVPGVEDVLNAQDALRNVL